MKITWGVGYRPKDVYFQCIWSAFEDENLNDVMGVLLVDDKYWITPKGFAGPSKDIGPFDTLEAAQSAAEIMVQLKAYPEGWVK